MADEDFQITVEKYTGEEEVFKPSEAEPVVFELEKEEVPSEVPPTPFIPSVTPTFTPEVTPFVPFDRVERVSLVLNIETLGVDPIKDRIITISFQDASRPNEEPIVLMIEDELEMLKQFFAFFVQGNFNQIIVYNGSFDFRFIFSKAMFYRLSCKEFFDVELFDMMQIMKQVKPAFVFGSNKAYSLSEWGDYLLKFPKPFTDLKMMEYYSTGQLELVKLFASQQITRTMLIYLLYLNVTQANYSGDLFGTVPIGAGGMANGKNPLTIPEANQKETWIAGCSTCLNEENVLMDKDKFICPVCGELITRRNK